MIHDEGWESGNRLCLFRARRPWLAEESGVADGACEFEKGA